jgi:hypothetical protein
MDQAPPRATRPGRLDRSGVVIGWATGSCTTSNTMSVLISKHVIAPSIYVTTQFTLLLLDHSTISWSELKCDVAPAAIKPPASILSGMVPLRLLEQPRSISRAFLSTSRHTHFGSQQRHREAASTLRIIDRRQVVWYHARSMFFLRSPVDTTSSYYFVPYSSPLHPPPYSLSAESQAGAFKLPKGLGATPARGRVDSYILIKPFQ